MVIGELEDEVSIFMRGYFIDVEDYYLLRNRDLVTYNVDDDTTITVDGNKAKLSTIKPGDYAQIRAYEDGLAVEIKVNSSKAKIKEWEKEREKQRNTIKDGDFEGKVVSISFNNPWQLTVRKNDKQFTFPIHKNVELEGIRSLREIRRGMEVELDIEDGWIMEIEVED